jgi:hypothetical protein
MVGSPSPADRAIGLRDVATPGGQRVKRFASGAQFRTCAIVTKVTGRVRIACVLLARRMHRGCLA